MHGQTRELVERYFDALNRRDAEALVDVLAEDVAHDINPGQREVGSHAFARFMERWNACYREHHFDMEIMFNEDGSRAAAEYTTLGVYLADTDGAPPSRGQTYRLRAGSFFEITDGRIQRVSSCHTFRNWQIHAADVDPTPAAHSAGGPSQEQREDDVAESVDRSTGG